MNWICLVNRKNWEIIKDKNVWGVSERHKNIISKIEKGDNIIFYIIGEKVFAGIYIAESKVYEDSNKLFEQITVKKIEIFPYRIKIKPIKIAGEPIKIKPLITDLEFITNKSRWQTHFFGKAMRTIPVKDYTLLNQKMIEKRETS